MAWLGFALAGSHLTSPRAMHSADHLPSRVRPNLGGGATGGNGLSGASLVRRLTRREFHGQAAAMTHGCRRTGAQGGEVVMQRLLNHLAVPRCRPLDGFHAAGDARANSWQLRHVPAAVNNPARQEIVPRLLPPRCCRRPTRCWVLSFNLGFTVGPVVGGLTILVCVVGTERARRRLHARDRPARRPLPRLRPLRRAHAGMIRR